MAMIIGGHQLVLAAMAAAAAVESTPRFHPRPMPSLTEANNQRSMPRDHDCGRRVGHVGCLDHFSNPMAPSPVGTIIISNTHNRNMLLKSLLRVRGGDSSSSSKKNSINVDDDVSAEELLDSLFAIDEPPSRGKSRPSAKKMKAKAMKSTQAIKSTRVNSANIEDDRKLEQSVMEKASMNSSTDRQGDADVIDFDTMKGSPKRGGNSLKRPAEVIEKRGISGTSNGSHIMDKQPSLQTTPPPPGDKHIHAAQYRKKAPGPPPAMATEDERRAHERHQSAHNKRKRLLSDLALALHDSHVSAVQSLIKGSAAHIPPALFGQTIMQEKSGCNQKFHDVLSVESDRREMILKAELEAALSGEEIEGSSEPSFRHIEDPTLLSYWGLTPNAKLYGGAQYHRVLRYYHHLLLTVPLPPITNDEVALLTNGITEVHDASDLMRAVALLVRHKMELVMEDVLADMTRRLLYVMDRQWEMVDYSMALHRPMGGSNGLGKSGDKATKEADLFRRHGAEYTTAEADLKNALSVSFHKFAEERAAEAYEKSLEDARALLRYITWDMGRARKRVKNQGQSQGFISQVEIVSGESADNDHSQQAEKADGSSQHGGKSNASKRKKKKDKKNSMSGHSNRMVARGGAAIGSGRKRSKLRSNGGDNTSLSYGEEEPDDEGDLIGGVMNRGKLDAEDDIRSESNPSTSLVVSSKSPPIFSGDDEVLNVLLDTVSSTLVPKSDTQGVQTQAAIERLVSYVTDKMRMDLSRMIRSKFNTFFLLAFYEDLGPYLRRELDSYLAHHFDG
ncbi:hypothetical protein ACHAXR_007634 [Thalassiosira sp. AJA248-18]